MTPFTVTHEHGVALGIGHGEVEIARYVYDADIPAFEAPKPYLHPLRTLAGRPLSAHRPHDHRWHKGLQMTWSHVSGQNFWGGNTYVHGAGYLPLESVGRMRHDRFEVIDLDDHALDLAERLTWITSDGQAWIDEQRSLRVHGADPTRGLWVLDVATALRNRRGSALELGSPTTHGRPAAGYTGWFWRGPRDLTGGQIHTTDGGGPDAMGTPGPWLAYTSDTDDHDGGLTLMVLAGTTTRGELRWFVRNDPFPAIAPSPAFFDPIVLADGETIALRHRYVIADGIRERSELQTWAEEFGDTDEFVVATRRPTQ